MRRLVTWALVTLGIAALVRRLKRRREELQPGAPAAAVPAADPADELRRTLAASRSEGTSAEAEEIPGGTVSERRAEVHDEGRAALDEMRSREAGE